MKMRYLCARHCHVVQQNSEQARQLWQGAYKHGVEAYRAGQWQRAEAFLGTAYEIALVRFAVDLQGVDLQGVDLQKKCRCLSPSQFAAVGRYHAKVLCHLQNFESAEICLRRVHDGLLYLSEETELPYEERLAAFELVGEFRYKLVALLQMTGREAYARCTDLITRQLARQAAASLYH